MTKDAIVEEGLYDVFFHSVHGAGTGVIYAVGGKLRGGNSAFTFIGNYQNKGVAITAKVSTRRYNPDPQVKSLFGLEGVTLSLVGRVNGDLLDFEGNAMQLPGVNFKARLSRCAD
ncbi:MAG: GrlR family regulatory protein [Tardiphaga sp.]